MEHRTTIRDVAQAAGVSLTTVSRYLNGSGYISSDARQRVERAIVEVGYAPNMMARGLKSGRTRMIILSVPDIGNPYYARMASTAQALCNRHGYAMMLTDSEGDADYAARLSGLARQVCASGILDASINTCGRIPSGDIPLVGMCAYEEGNVNDVVTVSHEGGVCLAVRHLASLGHTRIAFVGGQPDSAIEQGRRESFVRQMASEGLRVVPEWILEYGFTQEDGHEACRALMDMPDRPDAMCCANDLLAFGAMSALNEMGVDVPRTVSVTGMDDLPYAPITQPRLTTVSNDSAAFVTEAFGMLIDRIEGGYDGPARHVEIPNRLIVRDSTCPPDKRE